MTLNASLKTSRIRPAATAEKHFIPNFELHIVLLMGALVLALAGAAHGQVPAAQEQGRSSQPAQQLSPQAIPANKATMQDVDAAFDRADTNRDGKLDRQEAGHFPAVAQRFEQIDTNHDTYISREELRKIAGS